MTPKLYLKIAFALKEKKKNIILGVALSIAFVFGSIALSIQFGKSIYTNVLFAIGAIGLHISWWLMLSRNWFISSYDEIKSSRAVSCLKASGLNLWLIFGFVFLVFLYLTMSKQISDV
jgi:hypothetical protein